jgi:hypothetical protein
MGAAALPKIPSLQLRGCEVLAHFLGGVAEEGDVPKYSFSLGIADRYIYIYIY